MTPEEIERHERLVDTLSNAFIDLIQKGADANAGLIALTNTALRYLVGTAVSAAHAKHLFGQLVHAMRDNFGHMSTAAFEPDSLEAQRNRRRLVLRELAQRHPEEAGRLDAAIAAVETAMIDDGLIREPPEPVAVAIPLDTAIQAIKDAASVWALEGPAHVEWDADQLAAALHAFCTTAAQATLAELQRRVADNYLDWTEAWSELKTATDNAQWPPTP